MGKYYMNTLPVKLLTDIISRDEIIEAQAVNCTHGVGFCPLGVCLPDESDIFLNISNLDEHEQYSEYHYTPRAYFAIKVWETAFETLLAMPEYSHMLDIEWRPISASFQSIHFVNGFPEAFINRLLKEMEHLANSNAINITYGRFDTPPLPSLPECPCRIYIMPIEVLKEKRNDLIMGDELDCLQGKAPQRLSWNDIKSTFVTLKPIQLSFIAGYKMNLHTQLGDDFINACAHFDIDKVKQLVRQGANIHAVTQFGGTAMEFMAFNYYNACTDVDENGYCISDDRTHDKFIELAKYLLSLGYNINFTGYNGCTALYVAVDIDNPDIAEFLLDNGADPNINSYISNEPDLEETALSYAWSQFTIYKKKQFNIVAKLLLRHGALPISRDNIFSEKEVDIWIDEEKTQRIWDTQLVKGCSQYDAALIHCSKYMYFDDLVRFAQSGGDINTRDAHGRNLLQIVLEDAVQESNEDIKEFHDNIADLSLMLICGLKLKLSQTEFEQAKSTCKLKGYIDALEAIESVRKVDILDTISKIHI